MEQGTEAVEQQALPPEVVELAALMERAADGDIRAEQSICFQAATGAIHYQRAILDAIVEEGRFTTESLVRAEILARLIASHGTEKDVLVFASICQILAQRFLKLGNVQDSDYYAGEGARALIVASDAGSGTATDALARLAADYPAARAEIDLASKADPVSEPKPAPTPPPIVRSEGPLSRSERVKAWIIDRGWEVRFYFSEIWYALCQLGRALIGRA